MLQVINNKGELVNVKANDEGALKVILEEGTGDGTSETTLNASVQTIGTDVITIEINKKVTEIDIANYSDTANITVTVGTLNAVIGGNIATNLVINKTIDNISLLSSEADTKVQLIVKGVEL